MRFRGQPDPGLRDTGLAILITYNLRSVLRPISSGYIYIMLLIRALDLFKTDPIVLYHYPCMYVCMYIQTANAGGFMKANYIVVCFYKPFIPFSVHLVYL